MDHEKLELDFVVRTNESSPIGLPTRGHSYVYTILTVGEISPFTGYELRINYYAAYPHQREE
jgi:hypothetical protein